MPMTLPPLKWSLASLLGEAVAYGMNSVLFGFSVFFLITRRERNQGTAILGAMTVVMFSLATAHFVLTAYYTFETLPVGEPRSTDRAWNLRVYVPIVLQIVNSSLGDLVVVWRAWVLWDKRNSILVLPACLCIITLASSVFAGMTAMSHPPAIVSKTVLWSGIFTGSAILINLWAVVAIVIRYVIYRRDVVSVLGKPDSTGKSILILLIESGGLYCCTLIVYAGFSLSGSAGECVILQVMAQLTAIYPTLIIVLVCLRLTQRDDMDDFRYAARSLSPLSRSEAGNTSCDSEAQSHDTFSVCGVNKDTVDLTARQHNTPDITTVDDYQQYFIHNDVWPSRHAAIPTSWFVGTRTAAPLSQRFHAQYTTTKGALGLGSSLDDNYRQPALLIRGIYARPLGPWRSANARTPQLTTGGDALCAGHELWRVGGYPMVWR